MTQSFLRTVYSFLVSLLFFCYRGLKKFCNSSSLSNNYIGETLPQNFYLISRKNSAACYVAESCLRQFQAH